MDKKKEYESLLNQLKTLANCESIKSAIHDTIQKVSET